MRYKHIEHYLLDTLGLTVVLKPWAGKSALPYFLHDEYDFASISLLEAHFVLMLAHDKTASAVKVRKDKDALEKASGEVAVYVTPRLTSYERKRLVGQRVPFIVPGNQLYLPDLGIDLREYFRRQSETSDKEFSPATQALLMSALLNPWQAEVHPSELTKGLGYTSMTLSRAVKELEQAGLASVVNIRRERWLRFEGNAQAVWTQALPFLRNPVKQTFWAMPHPSVLQQARLAGESALAQATLLAEPEHPVYALSNHQWKHAQQLGMHVLPSPETGVCRWQLWRYDPNISPIAGVVDPLSLILSLRNEQDERVQQALNDFEKGLS